MTEAPALNPTEFATLIGQATDEQIEEGLTANRAMIIGEIFRRMPEEIDRARTRDVEAVAEWVIKEGPGGGPDRFQLKISHGECSVTEGGDAPFDVRYEIGAVDFLKLIAGVAQGPALFVFGKLRIKGNLMLAARMPGFFKVPKAG
jgi:putative sterol carrier protein